MSHNVILAIMIINRKLISYCQLQSTRYGSYTSTIGVIWLRISQKPSGALQFNNRCSFCEVLVCNTVKVESGESGLFYFFKHFTRSKVGLFNFITEIKFKVDITLFIIYIALVKQFTLYNYIVWVVKYYDHDFANVIRRSGTILPQFSSWTLWGGEYN